MSRRPAAAAANPTGRDDAAFEEDRRLAVLHLRLGNLSLARAELEDLDRRGVLETSGAADLADVRWRTGDLDGAATAATDHLEAGGSRPIALVIAAEAAAAAGRPVEARAHVEAMGAVDAAALDRLFAGMPRRAFWPSAPSAPIGPPDTLFGADRGGRPIRGDGLSSPLRRRGPGDPERRHLDAGDRRAIRGPDATGGRRQDEPAADPSAGFWGDQGMEPARQPGRREGGVLADPRAELALARDELGSGNAGAAHRGLGRLALVLRLDPTLAPDVLDALGPRRDAAALTIRGDGYRLLGRHLDAEAAFAAAGDALDGPEPGRPD
ncbi:MAG: hypothetical protein ABIV26_00365 [Candidatus Limnocylindrales bacterium]